MAWMSDEQYELMKDTREKKSVANSAFHTRSHCGKGGAVKFPSDYLSKKEIAKMSGECKSYKLNAPMSWTEFKELPDDLKVCYVKALRAKYNVPDMALAEMFGISSATLSGYLKCYGLTLGSSYGPKHKTWDKDGFYTWRLGAKFEKEVDVTTAEEIIKNAHPSAIYDKDTKIVTFFDISNEMYDRFIDFMNAILTKYGFVTLSDCYDFIGLMGGLSDCKVGWTNLNGIKYENRKIVMPAFNVNEYRPISCEMTFEGRADDILRTLAGILEGGYGRLEIEWISK